MVLLCNLCVKIHNPDFMKDLIFSKAQDICAANVHEGLNLEDKVLLSIAIRLKAEIFMIAEIRRINAEPDYWCETSKQFGSLIKKLKRLDPPGDNMKTLEKVSITVSSNIHLNSFMYEPILDLTIDHLIKLHNDVCQLQVEDTGV